MAAAHGAGQTHVGAHMGPGLARSQKLSQHRSPRQRRGRSRVLQITDYRNPKGWWIKEAKGVGFRTIRPKLSNNSL